ncbi:5,10-methylene-tetrahydrofolate reductase subunit MetV [Thermoanaerobacter kivui]|uniref:5,10-methylene-tetrahydrofolate reductase subunit MetV n=1 Tax=Thermoanaerobacter kivui TaxID=2325 RepID=A0A097ATJ4_THEKI|nr:methylenetetrahydrofolate reductase C-terminal domain-containing protein [Thermoanaerobacter kivui]AIS53133.1 5,10-methylene-tetrahydrofolate reductase subunit MetV [Thermoanaerobacter kivui]
MVITEHKPFEEILEMLKDSQSIFITGCSLCATSCFTGGEAQVLEMKEKLEKEGKTVTGYAILDPSCNKLQVRATLKKQKEAVDAADAILCMACGDGAQTVAAVVDDKPVFPANNTMFIGEIERVGHFVEACKACGQCELGWTAGICPITKCAKGLMNGPCGGSKNGKCEVNPENDCAWVLIYERLEKLGKLDKMLELKPPKDHSKAYNPRKIVVKK